jgi:hypothetical protein
MQKDCPRRSTMPRNSNIVCMFLLFMIFWPVLPLNKGTAYVMHLWFLLILILRLIEIDNDKQLEVLLWQNKKVLDPSIFKRNRRCLPRKRKKKMMNRLRSFSRLRKYSTKKPTKLSISLNNTLICRREIGHAIHLTVDFRTFIVPNCQLPMLCSFVKHFSVVRTSKEQMRAHALSDNHPQSNPPNRCVPCTRHPWIF